MDNTQLAVKAREIRKSIIRMLTRAGSGHTGGSLGMADVFTTLFFDTINMDSGDVTAKDRFIFSNGHICPVWYATLAEKGWIKKEELMTLRQLGSRLQGHPSRHDFPFAEISAGSLGQGFLAAVGLALAMKRDKSPYKVYASLGDGELDEGSIWEAAMAAGKYQLGNLIAFVDVNRQQQAGTTDQLMPLEPLAGKWAAFNWHVIEADGHDFSDIKKAFMEAKQQKKPSVILFKTHMGKGVPDWEDKYAWHGVSPTEQQAEYALKALEASR